MDEELQQLDPSFLQRLGRVGLSGVAAFGNLLDLPGSMVRDTLGLRNPFDQLLTPFGSENRTSGRDLLRQYGIAGEADTYANWWGGLAGEIALDPLTWTGAGALLKGATASGQGAKGLLRAGIPFTSHGKELLTGARSQALAAGLKSLPDMALKPSRLAPALESAAAGLPGFASKLPLPARLKGLADLLPAADDAVEEVEPGVRLWTKPTAPNRTELLRTVPTETLQKQANELDTWLSETSLEHADYTSKEIDSQLVKRELQKRAAGSQPITMEQLLAETPQGGIELVDMPTLTNPILSAAKRAPAKWAETTADALTMPARLAAGLFHAPFMGEITEEGQRVAKERWGRIGEAYGKAREDALDFVAAHDELDRAIASTYGVDLAASLPEPLAKSIANVDDLVRKTSHRLVRFVAETGGKEPEKGLQFFNLDPAKAAPELLGKVSALGNKMQAVQKKLYDQYKELGGAGNDLPDVLAEDGTPLFEHLHRMGQSNPDDIARAFKALVRPGGSQGRNPVLRYVPQEIVERAGKDVQDFIQKGVKQEEWGPAIAEKYGEFLGLEELKDAAGEIIPREERITKHAAELAKWGASSDGYATYAIDNLRTNSHYLTSMRVAQANIAAIHKTVLDNMAWGRLDPAVPNLPKGVAQLRGRLDLTQPLAASQPAELLGDLYSKAGLDAERSLAWLAKSLGAGDGDELLEHVAALKELAVPKPIADAIVKSRQIATRPEWRQALLDIVDIPTRWFKENVTLPFVSFATRNLTSGQIVNTTMGLDTFDDLKLYGQKVRESFELWKNGQIPEAAEHEWFTNGVLSENLLFEGVQGRVSKLGHVAPEPLNLTNAWAEAGLGIESSFLDKVPGLHAARQAQGAVLETGAKVNRLVEFLARVPMYETLKAKGWSPTDAAKRVAELQVDYAPHNFTPFENEIMRRLVPFYSWQRKIAPVILGHLAQKPTGTLGQAVRATRLSGSHNPGLPEYLGETLAIENPLGSREEGGQSFITGFGMPYEPILSYFSGSGHDVLAQLNPLLKAPLELATGQSFFQAGRPLDELNPPIGQTLANVARFAGRDPSEPVPTPGALEFAVSNSPLSRYVSTARQITDPRKHPVSLAVNLLTGARVADISPQASDAVLRSRADELLKEIGGRTFRRAYLPGKENLSETELALAEQLDELRRLLDKRGRKRREQLAMAE